MLDEKLDKLVQVWSSNQKSMYSGKTAQCGHHYYSRRHKLLRWEKDNIIPLTLQEHVLVHEGKIKITPKNIEKIDELLRTNYKDYLLLNGLTEKEFLQQKLEYWKNEINT